MNVRLQYDFDFLGGIYQENQLHLNQYTVSLSLLTQTHNHANTNVAMDRLKAFVFGELANTVFINQKLKEQAELLQVLGCNVTTLPEEPVDQIVGMMLYYKLNAIMENYMIVTTLDIQSIMGDCVWYKHDEEDPAGPFAEDGWWNQPNCQHDDILLENQDQNVVKVISAGWNEYGLNWIEEAAASANTVVYGNFSKNET